MNKKTIPILLVVLVAAGLGAWWQFGAPQPATPEDAGNAAQKADLIVLDSPRPNQTITSPLTVTGKARGYWFFEASFPVVLVDWDGRIIAQGIATAKDDPDATDGAGWMTEEFVAFEAKLEFAADPNAYSNRGALILQKDNPSGLPQNDDALEVPVVIK